MALQSGHCAGKQNLFGAAIEAFTDAIAIDPHTCTYWTNLGAAFESNGECLRAEQCYHAASRVDANNPDAYHLLSVLCLKQQRIAEARHFHHQSIVHAPPGTQSKILLGQAYYELGRREEACAVFADWLAAEPDNPVAQHLLAAYSGHETPAQCASLYVEQTFDEFARSFDSTLGRLQYCGPQLVSDYLAARQVPAKSLKILDLGCGTGLIGVVAAPYASYLVGVDISQAMLDQAQGKHCYQQLNKADLVSFLQASEEQYDLITCMDTLNYLGQLDEAR